MRQGNVWKGKTFVARWLAGPPKNARGANGFFLGTYASSALSKSAVKRNRMRRRVREAIRIAVTQHADLPTVQLLVSPRASSLSCSFSDIEADVSSFLSVLRRS